MPPNIGRIVSLFEREEDELMLAEILWYYHPDELPKTPSVRAEDRALCVCAHVVSASCRAGIGHSRVVQCYVIRGSMAVAINARKKRHCARRSGLEC